MISAWYSKGAPTIFFILPQKYTRNGLIFWVCGYYGTPSCHSSCPQIRARPGWEMGCGKKSKPEKKWWFFWKKNSVQSSLLDQQGICCLSMCMQTHHREWSYSSAFSTLVHFFISHTSKILHFFQEELFRGAPTSCRKFSSAWHSCHMECSMCK